jgi:hypothetical protein
MKNEINKWNKSKLIEEYKLILQKQSNLNRACRDLVELKIARMHKQKLVTIEELKINNQI